MENIIHEAYFSAATDEMPTHYHDCHQILFITKGTVEVTINGIPYTAKAGNAVIFSRFENHSVNILSEEYQRYVLQISPFAGKNNRIYALLANRPTGFQNVLDVSADAASFTYLFSKIIQELDSAKILASEMLQLLIDQLLILVYRRIAPLPVLLEDQKIEYIFELQHRFESQYALSYTLEALAEEYNVSPSSLSHQFKKVTGVSVMDYLLSCRMASAKKYLTDTSLGIGEIVELCGFCDNSNFSRTFKKLNGLSPSQFRDKYRT